MEFCALPTETKLHICSFLERRSISAIWAIQAVSKEFRDLLWRSRTHFTLHEWENSIGPAELLNRGDSKIIAFLDMSALDLVDEKLPNIVEIITNYSALEYLEVDEIPGETDLVLLEKAINGHKCLIEIYTGGIPSIQMELYRNIAQKVRLVVCGVGASNQLASPTYNFNDLEYTLYRQINGHAEFPASCKIVNGIAFTNLVLVGSTDGTIFVCDPTNQYHIRQTIHEHTNEITCLYSPYSADLLIGSKDGKVTRWQINSDGNLVLKDTKQFPEPIYFLYYSEKNFDLPFLFAASKHKVYFYVGNHLKKQGCQFDNVITGMHYDAVRQELYIATEVDIHRVPGYALRYSESIQIQTSPNGFSNLRVSAGQLVASMNPTELSLKPFLFQRASVVIEGNFDASDPSLVAFAPHSDWITCSNGPCLLTYDLTSRKQISCVSPRISKADLVTGNFPTCKGLWYSFDGSLHALFSENTVYSWNVIIMSQDEELSQTSVESEDEPFASDGE